MRQCRRGPYTAMGAEVPGGASVPRVPGVIQRMFGEEGGSGGRVGSFFYRIPPQKAEFEGAGHREQLYE